MSATDPAGPDRRPGREPATSVPGTSPRPAGLRRSPLVMRIGMALVFVGGLTLLVMMVLFASGVRDFPWWTWGLVGLAVVGFAIASFRIRRAGAAAG